MASHPLPIPAWASGKPPRVVQAIRSAAIATGLREVDIVGPGQQPNLVNARRIIAQRLQGQGFSQPQIGKFLGGRSHSTICNLLNRPGAAKAAKEAEVQYPDLSGEWAI